MDWGPVNSPSTMSCENKQIPHAKRHFGHSFCRLAPPDFISAPQKVSFFYTYSLPSYTTLWPISSVKTRCIYKLKKKNLKKPKNHQLPHRGKSCDPRDKTSFGKNSLRKKEGGFSRKERHATPPFRKPGGFLGNTLEIFRKIF